MKIIYNPEFHTPQCRRALFLFVILNFAISTLHANYIVIPERVVINNNYRSNSIILINTSKSKVTYKLKWVQKTQMSDGRFMDIPQNTKSISSASSLLIFSPHQFTIAPSERQTIRIIIRGNRRLKLGELRSHLNFQAVMDIDDNEYPFNIGPPKIDRLLSSFSIPVIVRHGELNASAKITSVRLRKEVLRMGKLSYNAKVTLNGAGINTAIGSINLFWKSKKSSDYRIVGRLDNVTLYPESASVNFHVSLNLKNPSKGYMKVEYIGTKEFKGKTFGELEMPVLLGDFKFENLK